MLGTLNQLTASQTFGAPPPITHFQQVNSTVDPLRELVLESSSNGNPDKLTTLALQAADLSSAEVIMPQPNKAATSVKNLAGIFAGTDGFVKKIERKVKKKYSALECSDSEGFGGEIHF